jgi:hypothetical protein
MGARERGIPSVFEQQCSTPSRHTHGALFIPFSLGTGSTTMNNNNNNNHTPGMSHTTVVLRTEKRGRMQRMDDDALLSI